MHQFYPDISLFPIIKQKKQTFLHPNLSFSPILCKMIKREQTELGRRETSGFISSFILSLSVLTCSAVPDWLIGCRVFSCFLQGLLRPVALLGHFGFELISKGYEAVCAERADQSGEFPPFKVNGRKRFVLKLRRV